MTPEWKRSVGVAGQVAYTRHLPDGRAQSLVGTTFGSPGPVVLVYGPKLLDQVFVIDAAQYGDRFDAEWVERWARMERR